MNFEEAAMQNNIIEKNVNPEIWVGVSSVILSILPSLSEADLNLSLHLKDLGADSIDRVEIIMSTINHFKLQTPLSAFSEVPNIGALVELIGHLKGA